MAADHKSDTPHSEHPAPSEGSAMASAHAHANGHDHAHHHGTAAASPRADGPLEKYAGRGKLLHFDAFSGVAGDMTIAALTDLGVPREVFSEAIAPLPIDNYELAFRRTERSGISAMHFEVKLTGTQPQRTYGAIDKMLATCELDESVRLRARAIFRRLGEAEAATHRMPLREVHFHEVGAVDAIIDIVGAAAGLCYLGADVSASALPMGRGFVNAQHGVLPLPAPATVLCLKGVPTYDAGLESELVTPTGAAIVATSAARFEPWPAISPERVGWGAGTRELPDRPNLLRLVLGQPTLEQRASHWVVEANIDDMSGELASHALEALRTAGAVDAWATPITMKKGRPALTLSALVPRHASAAVKTAMLRETTTIGVRLYEVSRSERSREIVQVSTRFGAIAIKVSGGLPGPAQLKPEFDQCAAAAKAHGVPVRVVIDEALDAYRTRG